MHSLYFSIVFCVLKPKQPLSCTHFSGSHTGVVALRAWQVQARPGQLHFCYVLVWIGAGLQPFSLSFMELHKHTTIFISLRLERKQMEFHLGGQEINCKY